MRGTPRGGCRALPERQVWMQRPSLSAWILIALVAGILAGIFFWRAHRLSEAVRGRVHPPAADGRTSLHHDFTDWEPGPSLT